jgi:soluble lytic murein transglycosylase-like protein
MAAAASAPVVEGEAPRVRALLEQGWAAESGVGMARSPWLAASLYRQAGEMGSGEGYFRLAQVHLAARHFGGDPATASCLFALASQLGHAGAAAALERQAAAGVMPAGGCDRDPAGLPGYAPFDIEAYTRALPAPRHEVVALIRKLAPRYGVDTRLALAVASAESNFNSRALSPKNAMGVMQLIPATAERFGVARPFDPEQNIRGGLAYLRWLQQYFAGDLVRVIAAYNAGERAVENHGGVPPYAETVAYVGRVLYFSGNAFNVLPATAAGSVPAGVKKTVRARPDT